MRLPCGGIYLCGCSLAKLEMSSQAEHLARHRNTCESFDVSRKEVKQHLHHCTSLSPLKEALIVFSSSHRRMVADMHCLREGVMKTQRTLLACLLMTLCAWKVTAFETVVVDPG